MTHGYCTQYPPEDELKHIIAQAALFQPSAFRCLTGQSHTNTVPALFFTEIGHRGAIGIQGIDSFLTDHIVTGCAITSCFEKAIAVSAVLKHTRFHAGCRRDGRLFSLKAFLAARLGASTLFAGSAYTDRIPFSIDTIRIGSSHFCRAHGITATSTITRLKAVTAADAIAFGGFLAALAAVFLASLAAFTTAVVLVLLGSSFGGGVCLGQAAGRDIRSNLVNGSDQEGQSENQKRLHHGHGNNIMVCESINQTNKQGMVCSSVC